MRAICAIFVFSCLLWTTSSAGAEEFPYKAYVNGNDVYVRSGPGKNYYPTDKLQRGAEVEIYRHDPGGWYAIRPLENSFSWIVGSNLRPVEDNLAEIVQPDTTAYVGSKFNDVHDVRQVKLDVGELVEIVGEKRFVSPENGKAETWYKIAPPRGEFRWVFGRFIVPQGIAGTSAEKVEPEARPQGPNRWSKPADPASVAQRDTQQTQEEAIRPIAMNIGTGIATGIDTGIDTEQVVIPTSAYEEGAQPARLDTADATAQSPANEGLVYSTTRRGSTRMSQLDKINGDISLIVSEPPATWDFQGVRMRAQAAVDNAASALERGRAKQLLREIDRYEQLKVSYSEIDELRAQTDSQNRLVAVSTAAQAAPAVFQAAPAVFQAAPAPVQVAPAAAPTAALRPAPMYPVRQYGTPQPQFVQQPLYAVQPSVARPPLFARQPWVARAQAMLAPNRYAQRPTTQFLTPHPVAAPSLPATATPQMTAMAAAPAVASTMVFPPANAALPTTVPAPTTIAPTTIAPTTLAPTTIAPATATGVVPTPVTQSPLTATAAPDLATPPATADLSQFDAVGHLRPVVSSRAGAPRFALTDNAGEVLMFISAPDTVKLQPHVGKVVGLNGKRGYMPRLKQVHLTVAQAQTLDAGALVARQPMP